MDIETNIESQDEFESELVEGSIPQEEDELESVDTNDEDISDSDEDENEEEVSDEDEGVSEEETVEIDVDGEKFAIPKKLQDHFSKNPDLEAQKATFDEQQNKFSAYVKQQQAVWESQSKSFELYTKLANADTALKSYETIDWDRWIEEDPMEAQKGQLAYNQLMQKRSGLVADINAEKTKNDQATYEAMRTAVTNAGIELQRDIPNWGRELHTELVSFAKEAYGIGNDEMSTIYDPRVYRVLNDAMAYRKSVKKATAKKKVETKPTQKIRGKAQAGTKSLDDMSMEEFVRYRRKQLAGKR